MKKIIILAVLIPVLGYLGTHSSNALALIACLPIFGWGYLIYWVGKWQRRFHKNRQQFGIHRAPSA